MLKSDLRDRERDREKGQKIWTPRSQGIFFFSPRDVTNLNLSSSTINIYIYIYTMYGCIMYVQGDDGSQIQRAPMSRGRPSGTRYDLATSTFVPLFPSFLSLRLFLDSASRT